jgi:hypothetical protein
MLSKCGWMYHRRHDLGHKLPGGISLYVGIAVDNAVTLNLDRKMMQGEFMSLAEIEQLVRAAYRKSVLEGRNSDEGILFKKDELEDGKEESITEGEAKAVRLAKLHAIEAAPNLHPVYLQRPLHVELPGYPFDLGGIIDVQELDAIRDTKTKGKTPARTIADDDDQLTIYALLVAMNDGMLPQKLVLDCLIDNKTPIYRPFETVRYEEDFDVLLRRIDAASTAIEKEIYIPARESDWWCGEYSCGFYKDCKYVRRSRRPTN